MGVGVLRVTVEEAVVELVDARPLRMCRLTTVTRLMSSGRATRKWWPSSAVDRSTDFNELTWPELRDAG